MTIKAANRNPDFSTIIATAQDAVANVENPRLQEIAFARILDYLLVSGLDGHSNDQPPSPKRKKLDVSPAPENRRQASGTIAWLRELVEEDFFAQPKSSTQIIQELLGRSHHLKASDITKPLQTLCHDKVLRRNKIATGDGTRKVWHWVNW